MAKNGSSTGRSGEIETDLVETFEDATSDSAREARERGLSRGDFKKRIREVKETRDARIRQLVDSLPESEREYVIKIARDIRDRGSAKDSPDYTALWEIDYKRKPVPIEQFVNDPYYLGESASTLFNVWRRELSIVYAPDAQYSEWLFGGAIGAGKSFVAAISTVFLIHRLSCLRNAQKYYGLASNVGTIVFGIYSVTMTQAVDVAYDYIRSFIEHTPYFRECFPHNPRLKRRIEFLNADVQVRVGSREFHALGQNLFTLLMDEANFMGQASKTKKRSESNVAGQAEQIYNASVSRLKSRFIRPGGFVPGMIFLISSKQDKHAFLERRKVEAADDIAAKKVRVSEFSQWEVKPEKYTLPKFYVEIGDRMSPSRILDVKNEREAKERSAQGTDVIAVPGELKGDFVRDIDKALRDLAGVATDGLVPLIRDGARAEACVTDEWKHPFTRQEITLSEHDDTDLDDFFVPGAIFSINRSKYVPWRNPQMPRSVHVDIAFTQDALGIACGHISGFEEFHRVRMHDSTEYMERLPTAEIDFMLRVTPPDRGEIPLLKVQRFIQSIRDMGLPISHVTVDGYQSKYFAQLLRTLDFETAVISLDKTEDQYMMLKQAIYDLRVKYYRHVWFMKELLRLERQLEDRKVDHPQMFDASTRGSKDVADAVCGVLFNLTTNPKMGAIRAGAEVAAGSGGAGGGDRDILTRPGVRYDPSGIAKRLREMRGGS